MSDLGSILPIPFERHQSLEAYQSQGNPYLPIQRLQENNEQRDSKLSPAN